MRTVDRDLGEETVNLCWRIVGALAMKCIGHSLYRKDKGTMSYTRWFHKLDAILVNVGALDQLQGLNGMAQSVARALRAR